MAKTIKSSIRESDILFRWGGEEFLLILPECDLQKAKEISEGIRKNIERENISFAAKSIATTVSLGVGTMQHYETADDLLDHLDQALYAAKKEGRNRVKVIG